MASTPSISGMFTSIRTTRRSGSLPGGGQGVAAVAGLEDAEAHPAEEPGEGLAAVGVVLGDQDGPGAVEPAGGAADLGGGRGASGSGPRRAGPG